MFHLKALKSSPNPCGALVENTPEGREGMALGQYIAGMGFSNVGPGHCPLYGTRPVRPV